MRVFICANAVGGHMELFMRQLTHAGVPVVWGAKPGEFSWQKRLEWFRDALRNHSNQEEKVVLSDGWDVVFQGTSAAEVEEKVPDCGVLIAGEKNCWPDADQQIFYPMGPTPWMFVNAGGIAGRVKHILEWLEHGFNCARSRPELLLDDQRFWTACYLYWGFPEAVDYQCSLFQTMFLAASSDLTVRNQKLINARTNQMPLFLHWNGGSNWPDSALRTLGMC
jgi:hypothetical protein